MDSEVILSASELKIGYNSSFFSQDLNITFRKGDLVCLLGKNGSGKTTLLRTLSGLHQPQSGEIFLNGKELEKYSEAERARIISLVFSGKEWLDMRVEEFLLLGRIPYTGLFNKPDKADLLVREKIIQILKLEHLQKKDLSEISDGERQIVFLGRALVQDTPLILLDEPLAYLDIPNKVEILLRLKELCRQGKTVIFSSHEPELSLQISDSVILVGEDVFYGNPDQLIDSGLIEKVFGHPNAKFDRKNLSFKIPITS